MAEPMDPETRKSLTFDIVYALGGVHIPQTRAERSCEMWRSITANKIIDQLLLSGWKIVHEPGQMHGGSTMPDVHHDR
jgi:hypothetical protein